MRSLWSYAEVLFWEQKSCTQGYDMHRQRYSVRHLLLRRYTIWPHLCSPPSSHPGFLLSQISYPLKQSCGCLSCCESVIGKSLHLTLYCNDCYRSQTKAFKKGRGERSWLSEGRKRSGTTSSSCRHSNISRAYGITISSFSSAPDMYRYSN